MRPFGLGQRAGGKGRRQIVEGQAVHRGYGNILAGMISKATFQG
jgi:hypothetical protein